MPTIDFIEKLRPILEGEKYTVIGADANGHSMLWHCHRQNDRDRQLETLIEDFDLRLVNTPQPISTYHREGMGESNIDVTLMTPQLHDQIQDWKVRDETDSDHNVLTYKICRASLAQTVPKKKRYNIRKANWDVFTLNLTPYKNIINNRSIDDLLKQL